MTTENLKFLHTHEVLEMDKTKLFNIINGLIEDYETHKAWYRNSSYGSKYLTLNHNGTIRVNAFKSDRHDMLFKRYTVIYNGLTIRDLYKFNNEEILDDKETHQTENFIKVKSWFFTSFQKQKGLYVTWAYAKTRKYFYIDVRNIRKETNKALCIDGVFEYFNDKTYHEIWIPKSAIVN